MGEAKATPRSHTARGKGRAQPAGGAFAEVPLRSAFPGQTTLTVNFLKCAKMKNQRKYTKVIQLMTATVF